MIINQPSTMRKYATISAFIPSSSLSSPPGPECSSSPILQWVKSYAVKKCAFDSKLTTAYVKPKLYKRNTQTRPWTILHAHAINNLLRLTTAIGILLLPWQHVWCETSRSAWIRQTGSSPTLDGSLMSFRQNGRKSKVMYLANSMQN